MSKTNYLNTKFFQTASMLQPIGSYLLRKRWYSTILEKALTARSGVS
jgi:hypothetical protein